jgi:DNA modification methylase
MILHNGDNLAYLKTIPDNYFDSIITDPPYGIEFLGKDWDKHTGTLETWKECLRVLKPGGYLLAFSAARTYHQLASNIELAGFEIRDQLMWLYSSGFPKAQDIGKAIDKRAGNANNLTRHDSDKKDNNGLDLGSGVRCPACKKDSTARYTCDKGNDCGMVFKPVTDEGKQWNGWKTALKPAHEPIVMARKPFKGSTIDNVLKNGLGAMNIDGSRLGPPIAYQNQSLFSNNAAFETPGIEVDQFSEWTEVSGRYPSNVIGEVAEGYQKYFYCPKVSRKERHIGFDVGTERLCGPGGDDFVQIQDHQRSNANTGNNHPTVKPVALMEYLIKLVTPPSTPTLQRKVLDPFMGSGSTGMAATKLGHHFTGCELDPKYVAISKTRIDAWTQPEVNSVESTYEELFTED